MTNQEKIAQEIENLGSSQFERLCYILVTAISGMQLIHRGTDSRGQPRRSTVDSYSSDGKVVGEYSVDQKYFCDLEKPQRDIEHALKVHPQTEKIYLLASVRMKPSEGKSMAALCDKLQKANSIKIFWYDGEEIAKYVLKELLRKTVIVEKLMEFLPSLHGIYLSTPNTAVLPTLPPNYQIDPAVCDASYGLLIEKKILFLTGISGIGKSALASKLARMLVEHEQLDAVYAIDSAEQIKSHRDLYAAYCELGGQKINLLGTLETRRSLVILDDLRHDVDEILRLLQQRIVDSSYVIITSQYLSDYAGQAGVEFKVPFLESEDLIGSLINWRLPKEKRCSQEQIRLISRKVKGYPLVLNCIRTSILYGNLDDGELESFLENIAEVEVEGEKKLMFRLLSRHIAAIGRELSAIQWLKSQYISEFLLRKIVTKAGIASLRKRSLIQSAAGIIKIHDIIYQCIQELPMNEGSQKTYSQCRQRFYQFFKMERDKKSAEYFKALHIHEGKIAEIALECQEPGEEWYFYIHSLSDDNVSPLPSFMEDHLSAWPGGIPDKYVAYTILEYIDYKLRQMDHKDPARLDYIRSRIIMLQEALSPIPLPQNDIYRSIVHHIGKLLIAANDQENAMRCFTHILDSMPESHETRLQVARIYNRTHRPELAILECRKLLDTYLDGQQISMSVVLAAYEEIYSMKTEKDVKEYYLLDQFLMFQRAVSSMAVESFDQPYKVLAKIIKFYTYNYPEKAIQLIHSIPIPSTETLRQNSCFAVAQMYKEMGKAIMWAEDDKIRELEQNQHYFMAAEDFYCAMPPEVIKKEFQNTQRAENLLLLGRLEEAEDVLRQMDEKKALDSSFWNYRMGQSLIRKDAESLKRALKYFQNAIDLEISKDKDSKYLSAFWEGKAKVLKQLGDPYAKECFEQALVHCGNDSEKFRLQLQQELNQFYTI